MKMAVNAKSVSKPANKKTLPEEQFIVSGKIHYSKCQSVNMQERNNYKFFADVNQSLTHLLIPFQIKALSLLVELAQRVLGRRFGRGAI